MNRKASLGQALMAEDIPNDRMSIKHRRQPNGTMHQRRTHQRRKTRREVSPTHLYLLAPFIDRAIHEGNSLSESQCYDFLVLPVLGGAVAYENIERQDFEVALNLRGQIHDQVRHLKPGTKISRFTITDEKANKPWWKFW
jgi:hypothetical protein